MIEIWKDIEEPGFENLYEVSNTGFIRTKKSLKVLKFNLSPFYYQVALSNCKRKCIKVHRLVAKAFIPNLGNKPEVNHKDGNRYNNRIDNLEWVTSKENSMHSYNNGLCKRPPIKYGENSNSAKLKLNQVLEIRKRYLNENITFAELARQYNVSDTSISSIIRFKSWKEAV